MGVNNVGLAKVAGVIIFLIGLAVLVAGGCAAAKPKESTGSWAYREFQEQFPNLANATENPYGDDTVATIGSYVIDVHHDLGIWDVMEANSLDETEGTARTAGLATAGIGVFLLILGGLVAGAGGKKIQVIKRSS